MMQHFCPISVISLIVDVLTVSVIKERPSDAT